MSVASLDRTTVARTRSPAEVVTKIVWAPATTWLLVKIWPSFPTKKPVPVLAPVTPLATYPFHKLHDRCGLRRLFPVPYWPDLPAPLHRYLLFRVLAVRDHSQRGRYRPPHCQCPSSLERYGLRLADLR